MRVALHILLGLSLSACASTSPLTKSSSSAAKSSLDPGACGLFGWSTDSQRDFIFFADEDGARYEGGNGPIDLIAQSTFPSLDYLDRAGNPVSLKLGEGEVMNGGWRYPGARIVTLSDDGWERVQPVAIVRGCLPE